MSARKHFTLSKDVYAKNLNIQLEERKWDKWNLNIGFSSHVLVRAPEADAADET